MYGGLASAAGVGLLTNSSTIIPGAALVVVGYACDYVDGKVARNYSMKTLEGAKLDPLLDKVKNFLVGGYVGLSEIIRGGIFLPVAMGGNFLVDYVSQKERGNLLDQLKCSYKAVWNLNSCHKDVEVDSRIRANGFGKAKTAIQAGVNLTYIGTELINKYFEKIDFDYVSPTLATLLVVSAGLGFKGISERRKKVN